MVWQQQSFPSWQVVQVCIHVHELTHIPSDIACALCLQFVNTLETNILTSIGSVVNVTITNVVLGSISVSNTIAFTAADSIAAAAGQTALAQVEMCPSLAQRLGP